MNIHTEMNLTMPENVPSPRSVSASYRTLVFRGRRLKYRSVSYEQIGATSRLGASAYTILKRLMDICGASLLLLLTLPIFVVIAITIKLTSAGPVLFKQKRLGQHGRHFHCYKFRTMIINSEEILRSNPELLKQFKMDGYKLKSDPRITKVGAFLRKTSLDEFPQFFNVLFGDMSLIGPRPIVPNELNMYGDSGEKLLCIKPGLGGMWQASGRSDVSYEDRVALDMAYVDNCSITMDVYLLFMTAMAACQSRGAY